jgi:MOSC domain-containing protein YiiM
LKVGERAVLEVMGLRNPCAQIDNLKSGLLSKVVKRDNEGNLFRKAGIMCIAKASGRVQPNDLIEIVLPKPPFEKLERV